jgi:putative PIN family toxin of toxin-antitoxin system
LLRAKFNSEALLLSNPVTAELIEVTMRTKFDRYLSKEIRQTFLEKYRSLSTHIEITVKVEKCRDARVDEYLELALAGKADCIITNDEDLLILNAFENAVIIKPEEFLNRF